MADEQPNFTLPPDAPERNRHHQGGYRSEDEYYEDLLGRGSGDIDMIGYPNDADNPTS